MKDVEKLLLENFGELKELERIKSTINSYKDCICTLKLKHESVISVFSKELMINIDNKIISEVIDGLIKDKRNKIDGLKKEWNES